MRTEKLETREIHDLCLAKAKRIREEADWIVTRFSETVFPHMREYYRTCHASLTALEEQVDNVSSECGTARRERREQSSVKLKPGDG